MTLLEARRLVAEVELQALCRPELEELKAYVPHDPPGIKVKLDANEAPPSSSPAVRDAVMRAIGGVALERYPDPRALRLKEAIARRTGARAEELFVGSGSDEVIALLLTGLARPRERAPQPVMLAPTPTFVMYRVTARGHGHKPVEVPLDASWDLDVGMMKRAIEMMRPNVVFVASPNNPTGNQVSRDRLRALVESSESALVVADEAYVDYAGPDASVRGWRAELPNLGVLRTVSKIGLAALRVGWLEADAALVAELDKVRQPFNVSATSQAAAAAVLEEAWDDVQKDVARVVAARAEVAAAIAALPGWGVTPSGANFVWVKTRRPASEVWEALVAKGVLVRSFHAAGGRLASQLRITIGTDAENEALVAALKEVA
ncbi:MAG: histidinol-phosphate transaminase [Labilithrix sp.]|nr:histidinol-phosphate transaminase [Labilithrix sp.]MCW5816817.1 histidinol-phosphate transaminase [Labilithrix sp.]